MPKHIKNIISIYLISLFMLSYAFTAIFKSKIRISVSERRTLAEIPELNRNTIKSGRYASDFEKYLLDHAPLRDKLRTIKTVWSLYVFGQKDNRGIYIKNNHASELDYPLNYQSLKYAGSRFRFIYDTYIKDKDISVYLSVIPDKNFFMAEKNGYPCINYDDLISKIRSEMEYAEYIDITHTLELSDYYRTDPHWRQEKITDVASYIAEKMNATVSNEYYENKIEKFFCGSYSGKSAMPLKAEDLVYLNNDIINNSVVYDFESGKHTNIYNIQNLFGYDKYEIFLSGSRSLLKIENPVTDNEKSLIIFRDSFGSSIAPLLLSGYKEIILVDIRYISPHVLGRFVDFSKQDVLFLYSTGILNNSITLK